MSIEAVISDLKEYFVIVIGFALVFILVVLIMAFLYSLAPATPCEFKCHTPQGAMFDGAAEHCFVYKGGLETSGEENGKPYRETITVPCHIKWK